ncbi:MAG: HAD-IB family phosphatase [Clostridium sp.]|nr:HAD-IB family phosphatase [Clostridium sp.]
MNVYDFDGTIYTGDSTVDFYFHCLSRNKRIIKKLPHQIKGALLYIVRKIDKTQFKEYFYSFLAEVKNPTGEIEQFWNKNIKKIKKWYLKQRDNEDVVISASPEFLLQPVCKSLGIKKTIASIVDINTGKYIGKNCRGEEKVKRFKKEFPHESIECFYSDTLSDKPMAIIAKKSFIVRGEKISEWD